MKNNQSGLRRKRQFLLIMPLLVIPFLTMAFWALGGGVQKNETKEIAGLNVELPEANLKDESEQNKLSFYEKAPKDTSGQTVNLPPAFRDTMPSSFAYDPAPVSTDVNEARVYQKIQQLNQQLETARVEETRKKTKEPVFNSALVNSEDVTRLENMVKGMNSERPEDKDIHRLNTLMDKILDVQHPERVKERMKQPVFIQSNNPLSITTVNNGPNISLLVSEKDSLPVNNNAGFYSNDEPLVIHNANNLITACIETAQTVVNGSTVKIRLLQDMQINNTIIPANTLIYGVASLADERLKIELPFIRWNQQLFSVALSVFDLDGLPGIYIPGSITRQTAKESADNSLASLNLSTIDPTLQAKAATVGLTTAKELLTRKAKLVKVSLKAGYKIFLSPKNQ